MRVRICLVIATALLVGERLSLAQDAHVRKALELFQRQNYAEALKEFEIAGAAQPGNAAIANAMGIIETKLGHMDSANGHYQDAIRFKPDAEDPHKNLGFNYLNLSRFDDAERELKTALRLQPSDPFPHLYLAMVYLATSREGLAVEQAQPSLTLLANDPPIAFQLVKSCLRLDRKEQAVSIVNTAGSGFSVEQRRELASLYFEKRMYADSVEQFRQVAAGSGSLWEDRFNLAGVLLTAAKAPEAIPILVRLANERPDDSHVLALLGAAYESSNQMPQALEAYRKETKANPKEADAYLDYTRLLMDLSRYDEAQAYAAAGLKEVREPYPLYMRLGSVEMMASKYDQAREWFQKAVEEHPEISVAYVALAQVSFKTAQNEQAVTLLSDARKRLKPDFLLEYYYGLALDKTGKQPDAVTALEKAVALNPDIAEIHFELGRLYFQADRSSQARTELEKSIKLDPQFAKSYIFLSRIYAKLGDSEKAHRLAEQAKQFKQDQRDEAVRAQESRLRSFQPLSSR